MKIKFAVIVAYLIHELNASVTVFDYKNGKLTPKQTLSMLAPDFKGKMSAADIHLSPDGNFLYGSNRGDANEVVIFSVDKSDGKLTYAGRQSSLGTSPRSFAIDPSGNFLVVSNQQSNSIVLFKRDLVTGLLSDTGKRIDLETPVGVFFTTSK